MVSDPPPEHATALAERAPARLLTRSANLKKRESVMMIPQQFELFHARTNGDLLADRDQGAEKLAAREAARSNNDSNLAVADGQKTLDKKRIGVGAVDVEDAL